MHRNKQHIQKDRLATVYPKSDEIDQAASSAALLLSQTRQFRLFIVNFRAVHRGVAQETGRLSNHGGIGVILPLVDHKAIAAGDIFAEINWLRDEDAADHDRYWLHRVGYVVAGVTATAGGRCFAGKR